MVGSALVNEHSKMRPGQSLLGQRSAALALVRWRRRGGVAALGEVAVEARRRGAWHRGALWGLGSAVASARPAVVVAAADAEVQVRGGEGSEVLGIDAPRAGPS